MCSRRIVSLLCRCQHCRHRDVISISAVKRDGENSPASAVVTDVVSEASKRWRTARRSARISANDAFSLLRRRFGSTRAVARRKTVITWSIPLRISTSGRDFTDGGKTPWGQAWCWMRLRRRRRRVERERNGPEQYFVVAVMQQNEKKQSVMHCYSPVSLCFTVSTIYVYAQGDKAVIRNFFRAGGDTPVVSSVFFFSCFPSHSLSPPRSGPRKSS